MYNLVSAKSSLTKGMKSWRHNPETCPFCPTHGETYRGGLIYMIDLPMGVKEGESRSCWESNDRSVMAVLGLYFAAETCSMNCSHEGTCCGETVPAKCRSNSNQFQFLHHVAGKNKFVSVTKFLLGTHEI